MDRTIIYPGAIPLETDLLSAQRSSMVAVGYLAAATVGSSTVVDGLACTAAVGALGVVVGPGAIFQLTVIDQNAFSSLAADADPVVKMGVNTSSTTFALTAPTVAGQTISYLLEAAFLEADDTSTVLPYFNASAPAQPFSGPGGAGGSQPTRRRQSVQLQLKAGVAAAAGTQALPAVDAGWVGLYRLDVNYGASSAVISVLAGAPFVGSKLPTVNAEISALQAATATLQSGFLHSFVSAGAYGASESGTWVAPAGVYRIRRTVTGGGGGGGGTDGNQAGGGGGAGGTVVAYCDVTPGQQIPWIAGGGGAGGSSTDQYGAAGGSSYVGGGTSCTATGGSGGMGGGHGAAGAASGVGSSSDAGAVEVYGGFGSDGSPGTNTYGGLGGGSFWGGGGRGSVDGNGATSGALGSGGGGAYGGSAIAGGYGGVGVVVIEY